MTQQPPFPGELKVFSGRANPELSRKICQQLGINLGKIEIEDFSDDEIGLRYIDDLRGRDVFVIQPTNMPNKNIMELFIMIDAANRASAGRITTVIPYYGYARKDRKSEGRDPISAKLIATFLTRAGAGRVLLMDLHSGQIPGFFDENETKVDHLYAKPIFMEHLQSRLPTDLIVVGPDVGAVKLANSYAKRFHCEIAIINKDRPKPNKSEVLKVVGDVEGKNVLMVDDMIDTAGTLVGGAQALKKEGALEISAACTHSILSGEAIERLSNSPISKIFVTDTIYLPDEKRISKIEVVSVAPLLAEAIKAIHENTSVSKLFI